MTSIWEKISGLFEKRQGGVFPEIKQYPPIPTVLEPPVVGEPASLIIKALQDDSLDWEEDTLVHGYYLCTCLRSKKKDFLIYQEDATGRLHCPGASSFTLNDKQAVIYALRDALQRVREAEQEKERLATIELFKEYREEK